MYSVKLSDGSIVELPKPEGERIAQLGLRVLYLNKKIDILTEKEVLHFCDDIIFILLDHWKQKNVDQPFNKLSKMVKEGTLAFEHPSFKKALTKRIKEAEKLVDTYKEGTPEEKKSVKWELKERGFIGKRDIKQYDIEFLRSEGIEV